MARVFGRASEKEGVANRRALSFSSRRAAVFLSCQKRGGQNVGVDRVLAITAELEVTICILFRCTSSLGRLYRGRACGPGAGARRESWTSSLAGRWCGRSRSYSKVSARTHPASCTKFCTFSAPYTPCRTKRALRIFLLSSHAAGQCHGMYVPAAGRHARSLSPCMSA